MPARLHLGAVLIALSGAALLSPAPSFGASIGIDFGSSEGEDFLEGGDGFGPAPHEEPRNWTGASHSTPGAYRDGARARVHPTHRSVTYAPSRPRSTYFRGTGVFANANPSGGSVIYVHAGAPAPVFGSSGPRIIDVEAERLDRASYGPSGISITRTGSMKIIRLAPDYGDTAAAGTERDMAALPAPRPWTPPVPASNAASEETDFPVDRPPDAVVVETSPAGAGFLEPWTDAWRQDCEARYETFDASLGTYTDADGLRRFCTGEAG